MSRAAHDMTRPLALQEELEKARQAIDEAEANLRRALQLEEEIGGRRRARQACEEAFHALVVLSEAVLTAAGQPPPSDHDSRLEALERIGRSDLANMYERMKDALHTVGYEEQRVGNRQRERVEELRAFLEQEL